MKKHTNLMTGLRTIGSKLAALERSFTIYRDLGQRIRQASVIVRLMTDMGLIILVSAALACFCVTKSGGLELYMTTFLPMIGILTVFFLFTEAFGSNRAFSFACALLILTGITLQILLILPVAEGQAASAKDLVLHNTISIVFATVAVPVLRWMLNELYCRSVRRFLNILIVALYLLLLVFGKAQYGTTAWLVLGGFSFQLTEITKVLTLINFGLIFTDPATAANQRLNMALLTLGINGVFLLAVNELGTLCVLGVVYFLLALVYLPSVRRLMLTLSALALAVILVLILCLISYNLKYSDPVPANDTVTIEPANTSALQNNPAVDLGAKIYSKFKLRMDLVLDPDSVDDNDGGYQTKKAKESLILSNWFGSSADVVIPVAKSDYIFCYLLLKMGVCFGIAVLLMMLCMLLNATEGCLQNPSAPEGAVGLAFIFAIVSQSLVAAASSTGYFITIGLPFAFLADGGSAMLTNYAMVMYIIYAVRRFGPEPAKNETAVPLCRKENVYGIRPL